jgi:GT2 family glycosyltransferase
LPGEVIVVDNGSTHLPDAGALAAILPGTRLLSEPTPGPGPARNTGVRAARGDILAFIDADCRPDPGWIAAIARAMADPAAQVLGGDVRIDMADPARPTMWEAYEAIYAYRMDRYIAREGYTGTGNLAIRRAVFDAVGPFAGIGVAEDRDWGRRATRAGFDLRFVPDMQVFHPARQSLAELTAKWGRHIAHEFADAPRRPGGRLRLAAKAVALPLSVVWELPRILTSDRIGGLRARGLALAGLAAIRVWRAGRMARHLALGGAEAGATGWNRPG